MAVVKSTSMLPFFRKLAIVVSVSIAASCAQDSASDALLTGKLNAVVEAYQTNRRFIGSVLVMKSGRTLLEKGYGFANLELDVPNKPDTKFRLGSITKQFTATAVLQLAEQGKLSVNDAACKYLEGCPDTWKGITIHQLLTHTSGIPSYTSDKDFAQPRMMRVPLTPIEIVMLSKDKPLDFAPGTDWKYDNTGYVFLGAIIEKVSGEKYADYLKKHIFGPLDMQDTGYDDTGTILKNRAAGYRPSESGFQNAAYLDMSLPYAAGSLYSTVRDLYRWDRALYTEKAITKFSREKMFTAEKHDYGYGLVVAPMFKRRQVGHVGGINGFSSEIIRFIDDDVAVIVLSNNEAGNAAGLGAALAGSLFGEPVTLPGAQKEVAVDPKLLDRYIGKYQVGPLLVTVTNEAGHLMIQPAGQGKAEVFPSSETEFFPKIVDAVFTFLPGEDGTFSRLQLKQNGATLAGQRIK